MIGKNIKLIRAVRDMSGLELANRVGVSGNYMYLIEGGKKTPSTKRLKKIAEVLRVPVSVLMWEPTDPREADGELIAILYKIMEEVAK
jgi:transcriptional regulator with XRE-family HTH domain